MGKHVTLEISPESELAHIVNRSDVDAITVTVDGRFFDVVERKKSSWDPASIRAHLRESTGFLSQEEAEEMKEEIYHAREEGSAHNFPE
jgi:hypothetical protein